MPWKTLKSEKILENHFFNVEANRCQKENGEIVEEYYVVNRPDIIVIAAFTPKMELVMIEQYRYPVKDMDLEIPAGYAEKYDDNLAKSAARELLEETGYQCEKVEKIHAGYPSAGFMSNTIHFFIGFNAQKIQEPRLDEDEEIEVKVTPWKEALKALEEGKVKDLGSSAGILFAQEYLKNNPQ